MATATATAERVGMSVMVNITADQDYFFFRNSGLFALTISEAKEFAERLLAVTTVKRLAP
jgi:hypothetical protein